MPCVFKNWHSDFPNIKYNSNENHATEPNLKKLISNILWLEDIQEVFINSLLFTEPKSIQ